MAQCRVGISLPTAGSTVQEAAARIVERFGLAPHPEGGFFREVHRSALAVEAPRVVAGRDARRCASTLIYFLLSHPEFSAFHRVRSSDEIWHLYAGGPLELHTIDSAGRHLARVLTSDLERGEPTAVVAAGCWQAARLRPGSGWAFAGCTVAPGFEFADFEMPDAAVLIAAHPQHERILRELTRR